ncbi:hypothetical protein CONPUDRAFT_76349 [Coniophora puteana RWD-64-598 SS2]|uniref:Uncharacterized protein n=1 Tax=Coniophora puteana (strain RWD-64-598) TaxID=741705 RepID=A0A5M3MDS6_CONPW|nr:uncharacterized protein CONPUDRAFT_76349 [Coniophora puteana RWD-64-598 SS2]EIW76755.1 hypothetical protein CONPUDRAFT_76349 [Coniophora puteana RWD-64-598 SS2]
MDYEQTYGAVGRMAAGIVAGEWAPGWMTGLTDSSAVKRAASIGVADSNGQRHWWNKKCMRADKVEKGGEMGWLDGWEWLDGWCLGGRTHGLVEMRGNINVDPQRMELLLHGSSGIMADVDPAVAGQMMCKSALKIGNWEFFFWQISQKVEYGDHDWLLPLEKSRNAEINLDNGIELYQYALPTCSSLVDLPFSPIHYINVLHTFQMSPPPLPSPQQQRPWKHWPSFMDATAAVCMASDGCRGCYEIFEMRLHLALEQLDLEWPQEDVVVFGLLWHRMVEYNMRYTAKYTKSGTKKAAKAANVTQSKVAPSAKVADSSSTITTTSKTARTLKSGMTASKKSQDATMAP